MNKTLYSVINPLVNFILSSPLHGLMSRNTVILEFHGPEPGALISEIEGPRRVARQYLFDRRRA